MKKAITFLLALSLMLGLLAGCGGQDSASGENGSSPGTSQPPVDEDAVVIDVFAGVDLRDGIYTGTREAMLSGSGHYWTEDLHKDLDAIEYDRSNSDIKDFLKSIDFYWVEIDEMRDKLKNGDTITVGLEYSKSEAEALGIVLKEESKTITVDWLYEVYRDHSQIPEDAIRQAYEAADPINHLLEDCNPDWYISGEGSEGPERYENYTYETSQRTFFQYDVDGNGEAYVKYLLVMVTFRSEFDWYDNDEFKFHGTEEQHQLYAIQMDQSDCPYAFHTGDTEYRHMESIDGESWDGTLRFADYALEHDTLVKYTYVKDNGGEVRVVDPDASIVEFEMN